MGTVDTRAAPGITAGLTDSDIDVVSLLRAVASSSNGAAILFTGSVRDTHRGREVRGLDYSAYAPMAEKTLLEIAEEAARRFETGNIAIQHRVGRLELGDVSVAIAVAHPHRARAFESARYIIEELKRRVPIWKREHYVDGTREWVAQGTDMQEQAREQEQ